MTDRDAETALRRTGFLPKFCDEVDPDMLLPHLALATPHAEEVINKNSNKSKHSACQILWGHICRMPGWPEILAQALRVEGYNDLYRILTRALPGHFQQAGGNPPGQQRAHSGHNNLGAAGGANRAGGVGAGGVGRAGGSGGAGRPGGVVGANRAGGAGGPPPSYEECIYQRDRSTPAQGAVWGNHPQADLPTPPDAQPGASLPCRGPITQERGEPQGVEDESFHSSEQAGRAVLQDSPPPCQEPCLPPKENREDGRDDDDDDDDDNDGAAVFLNDVTKQASIGLMVTPPTTTEPFHTSPPAAVSSMSSPGAEDVQMASSLSSISTTDTVTLHDEDEDESIAAQDAPPSPSLASTIDLHEDQQRDPSLDSNVSTLSDAPSTVDLHQEQRADPPDEQGTAGESLPSQTSSIPLHDANMVCPPDGERNVARDPSGPTPLSDSASAARNPGALDTPGNNPSSSSSCVDSLPGSVHLHADSDASVRTGIPESPPSRVSQLLSSFMDGMLSIDG